MADDAASLDVGADHEARNVGEEKQRSLERVAEPYEPGRLASGVVEQHPALLHRLVRDDRHRVPVEAGKAGQQLFGEQLLDLEPAVLVDDAVDHLAHVVAAVWLFWNQLGEWLGSVARRLRRARGG